MRVRGARDAAVAARTVLREVRNGG